MSSALNHPPTNNIDIEIKKSFLKIVINILIYLYILIRYIIKELKFMKKVNILVGRFQPFTKGHYKCVEASKLPTVICMINTPSDKVDAKHPFPTEMLVDLYTDLFSNDSKIVDVVPISSANIIRIAEELNNKGYQIGSWTCGTDRLDQYTRMSSKYHDKSNLTDDFEMIEVPRSDEDISATKARNCLLNNDKSGFLSMIPDGSNEDDLYNILKKQIDVVYKNNENLLRRVIRLERLVRRLYNIV